jgi:restriction system protein
MREPGSAQISKSMPIPDYQQLMLPLLKVAHDDLEHAVSEAIAQLAAEFHLSDEERSELLASGRQAKFDNRVGWARTYLNKALLLESTGRGRFRITSRGLELLKSNPASINNRSLDQYKEFQEFRERTPQLERGTDTGTTAVALPESTQTPEELLEATYQSIRRSVTDDLLRQVKTVSPRFFERLVVDLLVAMGYGGSRKDAGQAVGKTGDGGIDGIIKEDKLGLDAVYIQAKRWENTVGRPEVQAFAGSLEGHRARKGVFITTSKFSPEALDYVQRIEKKIVLITGEQLAQLMIDHGVGVSEAATYSIKKIDSDYFDETE